MTRSQLVAAFGFLVAVPSFPALAEEPAKAVRDKVAISIIEDAVKAAGGLPVLRKNLHIKSRFTYINQSNESRPVVADITTYRHPDAFRVEVRTDADPSITVVCQNRGAVWITVNNKPLMVTKHDQAKRVTNTEVMQITTLYPLIQNKDYSVRLIAPRRFGQVDCLGISITRPGFAPVIELYFNKKTKLLEHFVRKDKDQEDSVVDFADYKRVNGYLMHHTEIIHNGDSVTKYIDIAYTVLNQKQNDLFASPDK